MVTTDDTDPPPAEGPCETCTHHGPSIASGLGYCERWCVWRYDHETPACGTYAARREAAA